MEEDIVFIKLMEISHLSWLSFCYSYIKYYSSYIFVFNTVSLNPHAYV